jgi:tRNA (cmo5U34)-methyltransferase
MEKDIIFAKEIEKKFEFDEKVATVFDDMLHRSIPFYEENIELICKYIASSAKEGFSLLDIGCSTGNLLLNINQKAPFIKLEGIDSAESMIKKAQEKASAYEVAMDLCVADAFEYEFTAKNIIVCNYLLQFIRPINRAKLVEKIYDGLDAGGIFICSEKVVFEDKVFDKKIIDLYYEYKQNQGYSKTEITQKREALENVLIPYTVKENMKMFTQAGFASVQTLFQWGNFVTFVAIKN